MNTYVIGSAVLIKAEFRNSDGQLEDQTGVEIKVRKPSGTIITFNGGQITRDRTGIYLLNVVTDEVGTWSYRAQVAAQVVSVSGSFTVIATTF